MRELGYEVPDGYHFVWGGRAGYGSLMDNQRSWLERNAPYISAAMFAAAGGVALAGAATGAGTGAGAGAGAGGVGSSTLLRYGIQYGAPLAGQFIASRMASNAERDSNRALIDYYDRALDAEIEERNYRRGWDEEGRRYGRYSDQYGRESDEEILRYGRAKDDYSRLSDEEKLWYGRAQDIRDKNYGYQQYGNFVETLEPFRASGSAAISRMSGLLGGPTPADTGSYLNLANTARNSVQAVPNVPGRPTWNYTPNRPTWNYEERPVGSGQTPAAAANAPVSTSMPVNGSPQLVLMQAPDGSQREVPIAQAATFERLGARRLA